MQTPAGLAIWPRALPPRSIPASKINIMPSDLAHIIAADHNSLAWHAQNGSLFVFGYGSLMWQPGFPFLMRRPARLIGAHRGLCIYSHHYRGTAEKPGLVLGLDRGGACQGIAFLIADSERQATLDYLREREQRTGVYREVTRAVWLDGDARLRVSALCYVADRGHPQYAGRLSFEEQLRYIRQGFGTSGANRDYVLSTVDELEAHGFRDKGLHRIALALRCE